MKAGIAAATYAAESIRRAGVPLEGSIELSATVDEESGGYAGVAWLAEQKRIDSSRTDYVIIPEPLGVDRICIGHRGVYWAKLTSRGRTAHGSMPFLGVSAIEHVGALLEAITGEYAASISKRETRMPVVPMEARRATVNINAIEGGQVGQWLQSPCVADRCDVILDRRFLIEESIDAVRREISELMERVARQSPDRRYEVVDLLIVDPVQTPENSPLTRALENAIRTVLGRKPRYVASPGTYDHKHVARIAGVEHCVAYGPGILEIAHQPDEYCIIEDVIQSTKVLALAILELTRTNR
jgi:succinyl-diaminopimelate desuccinylase